MTLFFKRLLGTFVRLGCKVFEVLLIVYTRLVRGIESDPSAILVDEYTPAQNAAQAEIDRVWGGGESIEGELLVLVPFRDRWDLTLACLKTLNEQSLPDGIVVRTVLIDNGSKSPDVAAGLSSVKTLYPKLNIQVLSANYPFNYSRLNNEGFRAFRSPLTKWVLFLNNDVELRDQTIIQRFCGCLDNLPRAGVIGCTLLYPDRRIQHLFAAPGVKIITAHPLRRSFCHPSMEWFAKPARPVAAVTGAVMMVRAEDFKRVGFFDERLPTLGQDIVLCAKIFSELGKYSVSVASGDVIHYESVTKRPSFDADEIDYIYNSYGNLLRSDVFFSRRFSRWSERPLLAIPFEPQYPARIVIGSWLKKT